ncbi:BAG family molecular chaperone regulator 7 [Acorus gramineus]|uniref:BAG family molecular chaperone regulator 7 n=1 Tax=Acorus gramineus TaxID=55184 RepID=A0AAV9B7W0_ACOGR|nr:BAG family molecular chaperone regulator 7 [Acorus gramineus]
MSGFRRFDLFESSLCKSVASPFVLTPFGAEEDLDFALDLLGPNPYPTLLDLSLQCPFDPLETFADLVQIERSAHYSSFKILQERTEAELFLRGLCDRVSALELGFDRALRAPPPPAAVDRKYKWTTEVKGPKEDGVDRKYKWVATNKGGVEKDFRFTAEIKGKGKNSPVSRTYTFQASATPSGKIKIDGPKKTKKESSKSAPAARVVEIEEPTDKGTLAIRQAFARRINNKGKRRELIPQDAALIIQMSFRAHLVRRSQALRGLRDLAVAKARLKEIRTLFTNFSYRRRIAVDAEERQRFSEKIIVLLLTVDAIEGSDYMVRAAKWSMVNELEATLEVVDPQPSGKLGSLKRRKFNLPVNAPLQKELAEGVAEVVRMLEQDEHGNNGLPDFTV